VTLLSLSLTCGCTGYTCAPPGQGQQGFCPLNGISRGVLCDVDPTPGLAGNAIGYYGQTSTSTCNTDADCATMTGAGANYACISANGCVLVAPPSCSIVPNVCPNSMNMVTDGNFAGATLSTQTDPAWTFTPANAGSVFDYRSASSGGALVPVGNPPPGANAATFGATGSADDMISQTFATTTGTNYTLNFQISANPLPNDFNPSVGSPLTQIYPAASVYPMPCSNCPGSGQFQFFSLTFVASSTATTLAFAGRNPPSYNFLTNVNVCPTSSTSYYNL